MLSDEPHQFISDAYNDSEHKTELFFENPLMYKLQSSIFQSEVRNQGKKSFKIMKKHIFQDLIVCLAFKYVQCGSYVVLGILD